ncbi:MAG: Uma2 family endonuclease [Candidatus Solibacter usitatus]|nr:Uma2 family endonuclease [Candidatus Solibacter usitatus]
MQVGALASVQEYLATNYHPDCDYVDGVLEEREVGQRSHGELQGETYSYFKSRKNQLRVYPFIEQRIRISSTRYRVADLCLVHGARPSEEVFTTPPLVAIEVLSPEDRLSQVQRKIDDYFDLGVRYVWVIDPFNRRAWTYTPEGSREVKDLILRTEEPDIVLPLPEIFAAIAEG